MYSRGGDVIGRRQEGRLRQRHGPAAPEEPAPDALDRQLDGLQAAAAVQRPAADDGARASSACTSAPRTTCTTSTRSTRPTTPTWAMGPMPGDERHPARRRRLHVQQARTPRPDPGRDASGSTSSTSPPARASSTTPGPRRAGSRSGCPSRTSGPGASRPRPTTAAKDSNATIPVANFTPYVDRRAEPEGQHRAAAGPGDLRPGRQGDGRGSSPTPNADIQQLLDTFSTQVNCSILRRRPAVSTRQCRHRPAVPGRPRGGRSPAPVCERPGPTWPTTRVTDVGRRSEQRLPAGSAGAGGAAAAGAGAAHTRRVRDNTSAYLFLLGAIICFALFSWYPMIREVDHELPEDQLRRRAPPGSGCRTTTHVVARPRASGARGAPPRCSPRLALVFGYAVPFVVAIVLNELRHARGVLPAAGLPAGDDAAGRRRLPVEVVLHPGQQRPVQRRPARPAPAHLAVAAVAHTRSCSAWCSSPPGCNMGSGVLVYLAALQGIPGELYEAAEIDGAGLLRRVWHVTVPQTRLILSLMLMLQIVGDHAGLPRAVHLDRRPPAPTTVVYLIYQYAFACNNYGSAAALGHHAAARAGRLRGARTCGSAAAARKGKPWLRPNPSPHPDLPGPAQPGRGRIIYWIAAGLLIPLFAAGLPVPAVLDGDRRARNPRTRSSRPRPACFRPSPRLPTTSRPGTTLGPRAG